MRPQTHTDPLRDELTAIMRGQFQHPIGRWHWDTMKLTRYGQTYFTARILYDTPTAAVNSGFPKNLTFLVPLHIFDSADGWQSKLVNLLSQTLELLTDPDTTDKQKLLALHNLYNTHKKKHRTNGNFAAYIADFQDEWQTEAAPKRKYTYNPTEATPKVRKQQPKVEKPKKERKPKATPKEHKECKPRERDTTKYAPQISWDDWEVLMMQSTPKFV